MYVCTSTPNLIWIDIANTTVDPNHLTLSSLWKYGELVSQNSEVIGLHFKLFCYLDPGYHATSAMVVQSALCFLDEKDTLPPRYITLL